MHTLARLCSAAGFAAICLFPRAALAQAAEVAATAPRPRLSPTYMEMRQQAVTVPGDSLHFERRRPRVWGAVMELGLASGGVATLVVYADGTTSLYSSAGGGILGAGQLRGVRGTSDAFLRAAQPHHATFEAAPQGELPYPDPGRVRFYLRTNAGIRTAEAGEDELKTGSHRLSPLFRAAQAVLDELRPRRQDPPPS
jgi:hypothetical protein